MEGTRKGTAKRWLSVALVAITLFGLVPSKVVASQSGFVVSPMVEAGTAWSFAIQTDNSLWAWGENRSKQLGDGTAIDRHSPVRVLENVVAVSSRGGPVTAIIRGDGGLYTWGGDCAGVLGGGILDAPQWRHNPRRILDNVVAVSVNGSTMSAIRTDGSLYTWGRGIAGQRGDGTTVNSRNHSRIMENVTAVSAGSAHTLAIRADGTLWAWGRNRSGEVGDGTTTMRTTPIQVTSLSNVIAVSAGSGHSMAITGDGVLWAWGNNTNGRLGDGTTTDRYRPVKIMENVAAVSAGNGHTMAITSDGALYGWGLNRMGQLGDGTFTERHTPIRITENVASVSAGTGMNAHTIITRIDGSLYAWGANTRGQIGNGTATHTRGHIHIMDGVMLPGGTPARAIPQPLPETPPQQNSTAPNLNTASTWAHEGIIQAIALGLVPFNLQASYNQAITRAEFAALVVTLYENQRGTITGRSTFGDTNDVNVQKAAYIGVVAGVGNNRFAPNDTLTREQAAVMLARLADAIDSPLPQQVATFADNTQISDWARDGVGRVQAVGIMGGVGDNMFAPRGSYTREQSIITILRLFEIVHVPSAEELEQRVFELVNIERATHGLQPLIWHNGLALIARSHSEDMIGRSFFSHVCPSGTTPSERIRSAGISFRGTAENIAVNRTPEGVMYSWMNSEAHRQNILHPDLTHIGVGAYIVGTANIAWTQKFIIAN